MEEKNRNSQPVEEEKLKDVHGGEGGHPFTITCSYCGNHYHMRVSNGKCPQCGKKEE